MRPAHKWNTRWRSSVLLLGMSLTLAACQPHATSTQQNTPHTITQFAVPTANGGPTGITVGPDGNLWFTEWFGNKIGRLTPAGQVTEFPIPTLQSFPDGITAGPDGNLWFTENQGNRIGRITPAGVITEFPLSTSTSSLYSITTGPDGNLWFSGVQVIGRITPQGSITELSIPPTGSGVNLTAGPDHAVWFTDPPGNWIGRITLPVP
jgi:virginiamycin B lyase